MEASTAQRSSRLTDMVTVRAPSGFGDRIRAAARVEGVRPGALIREAISERIARAGVSVMNDEDGGAPRAPRSAPDAGPRLLGVGSGLALQEAR